MHWMHLQPNSADEKLKFDYIEKMVDIGFDSIKFSFQGTDIYTYTQMRQIDNFNELLTKIKKLYEVSNKKRLPFIHIATSITYETTEKIEKFKKSVESFCDQVTVRTTRMSTIDIDYL